MSNPICDLRGVTKSYRGHPVIDRLNLSIHQGEMLAIAGPSGSGKTTILNIIGLLEPPNSGALRLFGAPAPKPRTRAANKLLRYRLAYLFQNFALIDNDTVANNLKIALTYSSTPLRDRKRRIAQVLDQVGLPGAEDNKIFELSGGEQQRIAIARTLLKPVDLVLADEPTGSLDAANRDLVIGLLREINHNGKTIVIVTHDTAVADACDRTLRIEAPSTRNPSRDYDTALRRQPGSAHLAVKPSA